MSLTPFWLYRIGVYTFDSNHKRALVSETWLSETPEISDANTLSALNSLAQIMQFPFGNPYRQWFQGFRRFVESIYPRKKLFTPFIFVPIAHVPPLNPAAPECALRLQRVGASGGPLSSIGRVCYPIMSDDWYTDLPHRRHINVPLLNSMLAAGVFTTLHSADIGGRHYRKVIFHKRTSTWTDVASYTLLPNPVRIWQRWRTYDPSIRGASDSVWSPDQI